MFIEQFLRYEILAWERDGGGTNMNLLIYFIQINLVLAALGLRCCTGFPIVGLSGGYSLVAVNGLLIAVLLLLWSMGFRVRGLQ